MNAIAIHPFRTLTLAVLLVSSVGQSVLAQVNDDFADRIVLDGILPISETGSNVGATTELEEPDFYEEDSWGSSRNSVWWEWTAPFSGTVQIDTFGSGFDTFLAVYTGMTIPTLSEIARNNDAGGGDQSRVLVSAVEGTTYQITVDSLYTGWPHEGNIALTISRVLGPANDNDNFEDRIALPSVVSTSTSGSNSWATAELDEPAHAGYSPESSVWWEWTAPSSVNVQIDTFGSSFDTVLAVYTGMDLARLNEIASNNDADGDDPSQVRFSAVKGTAYQIAVDERSGRFSYGVHIELTISPLPPGPPNDNFADRIVLPSALPTSTVGSNVNAAAELDEPDHVGIPPESSVWWEWTAPSSGKVQIDTYGSDSEATDLAVYTGKDLAALREISSNHGDRDDRSQLRFSAEMGTTYQIAVDSHRFSEGNITLTISMALPNDDFADRIALPSLFSTSTDGSNVKATVELDEPLHSVDSSESSVWWEWTAPSSGTVQIDTFGSDFDTVLGVYTGMDLTNLSEIASNNNVDGDDSSQVRFSAVMGTTYQIAVGGDEGSEGKVELTISPAPPGPPNDNFADRIELPSELSTSAGGSNVNASVELDEPDHAGDPPGSSVWWEWTAPSSGTVRIDTFGSDFDTVLAVYTDMDLATLSDMASNDDAGGEDSNQVRFSAVKGTAYQIAVDGYAGSEGNIALTVSTAPPGPPNDNFEDRIALPSALPTSTDGSNVNASVELDEPAHAGVSARSSVWWEWTAPSSGEVYIDTFGGDFGIELAVYTGTDLAELSEIASNGAYGDDPRQVRFSAVKGTTYQVAVDSDFLSEGNITLMISMVLEPPHDNDNFEDRIALPSVVPTYASGSNVSAYAEPDEPDHAGDRPGHSVWWEWTAPFSGTVQIDTFGSDFDTVLAVYTGIDLATLREIASNNADVAGPDDASQVRFSAVKGTTYQIAVSGDFWDDDQGNIALAISMVLGPSNDNFVDRIALPSELPTSTSGSNVNASVELDEPDHAGDRPGHSVWWEWTAPFSGTVQIDTFGSDSDTVLAVYTGADLAELSEMASNGDDAVDGHQSRIRFSAMMGTTYQIAVDDAEGFFGREGNITLTISMVLEPPNDNFADRIALPSVIPTYARGSNVSTSVEPDEPRHYFNSSESSVWWEWTAPFSGTVQIDTFDSDFDTVLAIYTGMALATLREIAAEGHGRVRFSAVKGTTYQIAIDGESSGREGQGDIVLTISLVPPGPPNDNFSDRIMLPSALPTSTSGSNLNASVELDEPDHAEDSPESSVWWEWTAPSSGIVQIDMFESHVSMGLAVYTGTDLAALREISSNSGAGGDLIQVRFFAEMGTAYQIAVDGRYLHSEGNMELTISMAPPGPSNDNFADRIALPSELPTSTGGSSVNASVEKDEPDHAGNSPKNSVWWEWTAPSSGPVQIDTFGSDFNTDLAIYTGLDLATLREITSNNGDGEDQSQVRFSAEMGATYQIAVDGYYDEPGNISLNFGMSSSPSIIQ